MKGFRGFVITLGVVLTIMAFFPGISAFADGTHDDPQTTADEADAANDQATMKSFVLHAKQHIDAIVAENRSVLSTLYRDMRTEGVWRQGSVYLIALRLSRDGTSTVANHGKYTKSLYGASLAGLPTVKTLLERVLQPGAQGGPVCEQYDMGGSMRWSCAVVYNNAFDGRNVLIGGFDHDERDTNISPPDCPDNQPAVTAQQVSESQSEEDLRNFVKGAIKQIKDTLGEGASGLQGGLSRVACLGREGPWKHGSVYLFIMTSGTDSTQPRVFLNGNNPELTGAPFVDILDEDGVDVGGRIIEAAGEDGKGGIVRYKWDDPLVEGDEINEPGMSPGTSPKISYVEGAQIHPRLGVWIFGSGIYPPPSEADGAGEMGSDGGDDGCAVAGTNSKPWSAVFNLFLVVFSICIAFWWRDRSKK